MAFQNGLPFLNLPMTFPAKEQVTMQVEELLENLISPPGDTIQENQLVKKSKIKKSHFSLLNANVEHRPSLKQELVQTYEFCTIVC